MDINIRPGFGRTKPGMESASDGGRIRRNVPRPEVRRTGELLKRSMGTPQEEKLDPICV